MINDYIAIARPEHWIKNIFVVAGSVLALLLSPAPIKSMPLFNIIFALISVCLVASSNYVLNEILDAKRDRWHPKKSDRPLVKTTISISGAYTEYVLLAIAGLALGWCVNSAFFHTSLVFWIMGIVYNVPPIRSKELPILDVLTEAINNPIRLCIGWFAVDSASFPPSSIILSFWMLGAFLMAAKRLAELKEINDPVIAANYRSSFSWYTENRLVITLVAYSSGCMFFSAIAMMKYHPELILSAPFLMVLFGYILKLTYEPNSVIQNPELLFRKPLFIVYSLFISVLMYLLLNFHLSYFRSIIGYTN